MEVLAKLASSGGEVHSSSSCRRLPAPSEASTAFELIQDAVAEILQAAR